MSKWRIVAALTAALLGSAALAQSNNNGAKVGPGGFMLNIIAFENCPTGTFLGSNRHQIAVLASHTGSGTDKTYKTNKIFLSPSESTDFWVEDGNACDDGALFHLPITHLNCDNCDLLDLPDPTFTQYEVKARLVGKPGSGVELASCVEEAEDDSIIVDDDLIDTDVETLCSVASNVWVATRIVGNGKEQNRFENVSAELLTVCVNTDDDPECDDRLGLFDTAGADYWWNVDTDGRPHVQLVFIPAQSGSQ